MEVARAAALAPGDEARLVAEAQARGTRGFKRWRAEQRGEPERVRIVLEVDREGEAWINEGCRAIQSEGKSMTRGEAVVELVRRAISGERSGGSGFRVFLNHDLDTGQTSLPTSAGEVALSPELAERLLCDAELQDPSGKVTRTIPTKARNQIDARSLGICEVPRCGLRGYLENHHNRGWRAGHDVDDMLCLCAGHHSAVHKGSLRIRGSWRVGLTFCQADGTVWATLPPRPQSKRRAAPASPASEGAEGAPLEDEAPAEEPVARATPAGGLAEHAEDEDPTEEEPVARATPADRTGEQVEARAKVEEPVARTAERAEDEGPTEEPVARATPADGTGERAEAGATVKRNTGEDTHEVANGSTSEPAWDKPGEEERGERLLEFTYREAKRWWDASSSFSWAQTPESSSTPRSGSRLPQA